MAEQVSTTKGRETVVLSSETHSAVRHGTVDFSTTILEEVDTSAMRRVASSMKLDVVKKAQSAFEGCCASQKRGPLT
jgi:hypothetical protein